MTFLLLSYYVLSKILLKQTNKPPHYPKNINQFVFVVPSSVKRIFFVQNTKKKLEMKCYFYSCAPIQMETKVE